MHSEVMFEHNGTKREVYRFVLLDTRLVFDGYTQEERATTKHKWRVTKYWSRLRFSSDGAACVPKPALTDVVKVMAKQNFVKNLTVEA